MHAMPMTEDIGAVASRRRTFILCTIILGIAAFGLATEHAATGPASPAEHPSWQISLYVWLIALEVLLLRFVSRSLKAFHTPLSALVSECPVTARSLAIDSGIGLGLLAAWFIIEWALGGLLGSGDQRSVDRLILRHTVEVPFWILLSMCAGVIEELVFRGFLQRQFAALSGQRWVGVGVQALLFGIAHLYQGWILVLHITLFGLFFGIVASLRRSLIPGMVAHTLNDLAAGLSLLG
jgi:membrane protease YdiL (CAAX protease family)